MLKEMMTVTIEGKGLEDTFNYYESLSPLGKYEFDKLIKQRWEEMNNGI
jgi:hypothetical protein